MLSNGLRSREYAKYRETRNGETAVAVVNEDEAIIETLEVTASGDTEILPTPGSTEYILIKGFQFSNDGSKVTVSLKAGEDGKEKFKTTLLADGGNFDKNLIGRYWRLPINKPLIVNLSGAGNVFVTIEYEGLREPGPEAADLSDTLAISEEIAVDVATPLADSQTIAEAVVTAEDDVEALSDSVEIVDSGIEYTESKVIALSDELPLTESVGNSTTTELSESDALVITESVDVDLSPTV